MPDLREQLRQLLQGRVCLMGLGNTLYGDDAFGMRLAEELKSEIRNPKSEGRREGLRNGSSSFGLRTSFGLRASDFGLRSQVIIAGTAPERWLGRVAEADFDHVVFLDAVDFGGAPGSVVLLNSGEMAARFPQISTHKLSLGLLAQQVETNGRTKAWLLGVQPESLKPGGELTPTVRATLELLLEVVRGCLARSSGDDEAPASVAARFKANESLSLVTSAATGAMEVAP